MNIWHKLGKFTLYAIGILVIGGVGGISAQILSLPFAGIENSHENLFRIENEGTGSAIEGLTSSNSAARAGVYGHTATAATREPGLVSGVWGDSAQGFGVVGTSNNIAVFGLSGTGIALDSFSESGIALLLNTRSGTLIEANSLDAQNTPNRRFFVSNTGEVFADGNFSANGADIADLFPTHESLTAGDVLVILEDGTLAKSDSAFAPNVVGVYSSDPAFLGNYESTTIGTHQVPLALAGVVPVKVSAENGVIRPGDLLTASSISGHAMRAGDEPLLGSVIGKALSSLESETGTIQMLVMLR